MAYLHMTLTLEISTINFATILQWMEQEVSIRAMIFFYVKIFERIYQTLYKIKRSNTHHHFMKLLRLKSSQLA